MTTQSKSPTPRPETSRQSLIDPGIVFGVLCALFVGVSVLYGLTIPIFETPDASGHYAYIHELTEGRGLPVQGTPSGARVTGYVASHPPLYYALCAALTFWVPDDMDFDEWVWRNPHQTMGDASRTVNKNMWIHRPTNGTALTAHIARLVSTALGLVAVVATYSIALTLFPDRRWLALGAASLAAFNPMFIFTSARVSNDAAVVAFGSLTIWGAVRLATRGLSRRALVLLGAALGLAVLSKLSAVALAPAVALALLFDATRDTLETEFFSKTWVLSLLVDTLILFGTTALVCGWWFVRNWLLYGEVMGVNAWLSHTATVRPEPIGLLAVIPELRGLEKSYWAMFGWFNINVAPWMYRFWRALTRLSALGLILVLIDQWWAEELSGGRRFSRPVQAGLVTLTFAFLLIFGSVWRFIMIVLGSQGRYLMPVISSISILLMLGVSRLVRILPTRLLLRRRDALEAGLAALVGLSHLALTLICLFAFIRPAYARPAIVQESQLPAEMERLDLHFDGTPIQLLGGHIDAEDAHPGDLVPVSLYWSASERPQQRGRIFAFVQILGRDREPIAGVDCYPGRGNFPPTLWHPGVIYHDRYRLRLPRDAEVPVVAALNAGLRTEEGQWLSARRSPDQPPLELVILDVVPLRPQEPSADVTHPVDAKLGEAITLVGYDLSPPTIQQTDSFTVTLVWRAAASLETDYTAFVHLMDKNGALVAQDDDQPLSGEYPTSFWAAGDVIRDPHPLALDAPVSLDASDYTLVVGMYHPQTGERLPAYDDQGARLKDDTITLQVGK